jgi:hypothetical protein
MKNTTTLQQKNLLNLITDYTVNPVIGYSNLILDVKIIYKNNNGKVVYIV